MANITTSSDSRNQCCALIFIEMPAIEFEKPASYQGSEVGSRQKAEEGRALKNCLEGNFSEGARLPRRAVGSRQ